MKKIVLYGIIIFQLLLIISLVRGIQLSLKSRTRIANLEVTKQKLEEEQKKLTDEQAYVQSPFYLEKVARDELHLSKPGETVVILPESVATSDGPADAKAMVGKGEKPNWQKWFEVLSGKID